MKSGVLEKVKGEKKIRGIIYYEKFRQNYQDLFFLLLNRKSIEHPGYEFIKGGFEEIDGTLEDTLYREIREETGLIKKDFVKEPIKIDIELPEEFVTYIDGIQAMNYLLKVGYPPPKIKVSNEHYSYSWCDFGNTVLAIGNRDPDRLGDWLVFPRVFFEAKASGYL